MLARCARCQGTFTAERFGLQRCPHCGAELLLADPNAPPGSPPEEPPLPEPHAPPPAPRPGPSPPWSPGEPPSGAVPPLGGAGPTSAGPGPFPGGPDAPPGRWPPPAGGPGAPPAGWGAAPPGEGPPPGAWVPLPGGGWGQYPPPPPVPGELPAPFAERGKRGFFSGFIETWKLVALQPQRFFGRVRADQTGAAVLFAVLASSVGNTVAAVYNYFTGEQAKVAFQEFLERMPEEQGRFLRGYSELFSGGATIAQVIVSPIVALVVVYVAAAVLHLLLVLLRGANRSFDATLTAVAYANGLNLLLVIPGCGGVLAAVWGIVVLVIGLGQIQRCGTGKAAAAVLAPAALACVCCCAALGISAPGLLERAGDAARSGTTNL
jgi:hypothetical protein